jgi:hypothetical protein
LGERRDPIGAMKRTLIYAGVGVILVFLEQIHETKTTPRASLRSCIIN